MPQARNQHINVTDLRYDHSTLCISLLLSCLYKQGYWRHWVIQAVIYFKGKMNMALLSKFLHYLRDSAVGMGEEASEDDDFLLLEKELCELKDTLLEAKGSEALMLAKQKQTDYNITIISEKIEVAESSLTVSLNTMSELQSFDIAENIAQLRIDKEEENKQAEHFFQCAQKIRRQIQVAESHINNIERQLQQIQTMDSVQKIQESILTEKESLAFARKNIQIIKESQALFNARMEALKELEDESNLDKKLQNAGIVESAVSGKLVMSEFKERSIRK